jgi:hypothetical protein
MVHAQNSAKTAKKRTRGRPFRPGVSGNPGGRPKAPAGVLETFRAHFEKDGEEVIAGIFKIATAKQGSLALRAAELILDRLLGRPRQAIEMDVTSADFIPAETKASLFAAAALEEGPAAVRAIQRAWEKVRKSHE